jgi:eukaryotic-like serine/threonine-protein kinase
MGLFDSFKSMFAGSGRVNIQDRFEIMREAISGTMSEFFLARDRKQDGKIVGLKILNIEKTDAVEGRFKALNKPSEGEIGLSLKHPRIVETYEHGLTAKGEQYIVMEFLDGPGLNSLIVGRDPRLKGKRLNLLRQAAEALAYVHQAGYIHRDVCPRNYVCSKDLSQLKLIDFGLSLPAKPEFMQPGNRVGTPNYMAPEVVRRKKTDHRVDIFAFGVTAFELYAFELPFPRGNATGTAALNHDKMEPRALTDFCPKIDPTLAAAIRQCLNPAPEQRPQSMAEFLKMIADIHQDGV